MCLSRQRGLIIVFGAVEGLLLFLCGSGEYDELTLADMLSTLAKSIVTLCRQGGKNQRATETVRVVWVTTTWWLDGGLALSSCDIPAIL